MSYEITGDVLELWKWRGRMMMQGCWDKGGETWRRDGREKMIGWGVFDRCGRSERKTRPYWHVVSGFVLAMVIPTIFVGIKRCQVISLDSLWSYHMLTKVRRKQLSSVNLPPSSRLSCIPNDCITINWIQINLTQFQSRCVTPPAGLPRPEKSG